MVGALLGTQEMGGDGCLEGLYQKVGRGLGVTLKDHPRGLHACPIWTSTPSPPLEELEGRREVWCYKKGVLGKCALLGGKLEKREVGAIPAPAKDSGGCHPKEKRRA